MENEWIVLDLSTGLEVSYGRSPELFPLIIEPNTLSMNHTYQLTFKSRYINAPDTVYGSVYGLTTIVSSPTIRSYRVSPDSGVAFDTTFSFSISATDIIESYPLSYSLSYYHPTENRYIMLRALANKGAMTSLLPGFNSTESLTLKYTVTNVYGSSSEVTFPVPVTSDLDEDVLVSRVQDFIDILDSPSNNNNLESYMSLAASAVDILSNSTVSTTHVLDGLLGFLRRKFDEETHQGTPAQLGTTLSRSEFLNVLTRSFNQFSERSVDDSLTSFDRLLDACVSSKSDMLAEDQNKLGQIISNLHRATNTDNSSLESLSMYIPRFVEILGSEKVVYEAESKIVTPSYELIVRVDDRQSILMSEVETSLVTVQMPSSMKTLEDGDFIVQALSIDTRDMSLNNSFSTKGNESAVYSSPIVDFRLIRNGKKMKLQDLEKPISIVLRRDLPLDYNLTDHRIHCFYKDDIAGEDWKRKGCKLHAYNNEQIFCRCTHTTSFSSMVIYDPKAPNKASIGLYVTFIIVHSIFAIVSAILLVMSFVWMGKQPIRSRFLTPFIGLSAILTESILNGIIRNSLLIAANDAKDYKGVNSIAYIIMSIVNPLVLVSLFVYLWQMIRYFFLKNLYAIMDFSDPNQAKMRILRFISSKLVYCILALSIWVTTTSYFVLLSILEPTNVIKANPASALNALSFSLMSLTLGVLIICAFVWDLTIILSRKFYKRQLKEKNEEQEDNVEINIGKRVIRTLVNHFTHDDPLLFRIESIFMVCALLVMTVSYIIGISDRFDRRAKPNSAAKILEFLFDVAYITLRLLAFGGFSVLVRLVHRFKFHQNYEEYTTLKSSINDLKTGISTIESRLQAMLTDEMGYQVFSDYCKKEFALENLLLWKRLEYLRSENITLAESDQKRKVELEKLDQEFLARGSHYECNVPSKVRKQFKEILSVESPSAVQTEEVLLSLFNEVMVNICDTFTRFSVSNEYQRYLKYSQMVQQLKDTGVDGP